MYRCIHFCLYMHFDLIALFTLAINNHFNVYFHTHLLNEIKRRHFLWTNSLSTSPLMLLVVLLLSCKNGAKCLKEGDKLQLTSFMALRLFCFCRCCLLLLLLLFVVSCYWCCTHSGSVALQLQARVTNWTILIFSHSFCCLCHHLCRVTPSCFCFPNLLWQFSQIYR